MPTEEAIKLTAIDLYNRFEIEAEEQDDLVLIKEIIGNRIRYLIDTNVEQLMQVLYRIDVNEQQVKEILAEQPLDIAIELIAELIINRQMQKVTTRLKYKQPKGDW